MVELLIFGFLITLGYISGSIAEKNHYSSIKKREQEMIGLPVISLRKGYPDADVQDSFLVMGSAVISIDYFKRLLAVLRNIVGGRVKSYESLVDRARREALLRMKAKAVLNKADVVVNFRIETSAIGQSANSKNQVGSVEVLAYGTAIVLHKR